MAKQPVDQRRLRVTEHEGLLLSLVARRQPVTAYQLFKMHEQSPVISINSSKGQLYPAIRRLKERRLLEARTITGDARGAEELCLTDDGHSALGAWVKSLDDSHIVLDDPLRTRVPLLDVLSREEQLEWIARAKALVKARLAMVEDYDHSAPNAFQQFAQAGAMQVLRAKMEWLDELLYHVAATK